MRTQPPPDPAIDERVPEGFRVVWVESADWRIASAEERETRPCRRPGCQRTPVAALLRTAHYASGKRYTWWFYCDWHLYGRRIEGERVLGRRWERIE